MLAIIGGPAHGYAGERAPVKHRADEALVWFRRDLRDYDHAALHAALSAHRAVHCAFVFDTGILDALPARADRRVAFIHESLVGRLWSSKAAACTCCTAGRARRFPAWRA